MSRLKGWESYSDKDSTFQITIYRFVYVRSIRSLAVDHALLVIVLCFLADVSGWLAGWLAE